MGALQKLTSLQDAWPEPNPPLGRLANYSSLRKHRPGEHHIHVKTLIIAYFYATSLSRAGYLVRPARGAAALRYQAIQYFVHGGTECHV